MTHSEPDPITEGWINLARRDVPGDTPEEKLENFMMEMAYLPDDILAIMREVMAEAFGVKKRVEPGEK